jgi:hypothetical protein
MMAAASIFLFAGLSLGPAPVTDDPFSPREPVAAEPAPAPAPVAEPAQAEAPAPAPAPSEPDATDPPEPSITTIAPQMPEPAPSAASAGVIERPHTYRDVPIRWRLDVSLAGGTTIVTDTSYLAFSDASRNLPGLAATVRADVPLARGRVFLGGGLGYRWGVQSGSLYEGVLFQSVATHDVLALARASVRTVEGVDVYAEAGIGPGIVLSDATSDDHYATDRRIVPAFEALGGLAVYLPKRWLARRGASRVTGGLDFGLGYAFHGNVVVRPTDEPWDGAIETRAPDLGDVALRGFVWRMGVFIRFM